MNDWKIRINSMGCEWEYEVEGIGGDMSIQKVMDAIADALNITVVSSKHVRDLTEFYEKFNATDFRRMR